MIPIMLSDDRTEVDMDRLGAAFSVTRSQLENRIRLGLIRYWFEMGGSDYDTPRMTFHSSGTGTNVTLDRVGNIISHTSEARGCLRPNPSPTDGSASVAQEAGILSNAKVTDHLRQASIMTVSQGTHRDRLDSLLDEALRESFPASDPIAISFDTPS